MSNKAGEVTLFSRGITTAITALESDVYRVNTAFPKYLAVTADFVYVASAATSVKAWIQTSVDGGLTWVDIMNFAFTTATARKVSAVHINTALAAAVTPTDGTLADNTILNGLLGNRFRVKVTSVGTYGVGTSLLLTALLK